MAKKRSNMPIGSVLFTYVGSDSDFEKFLKAVVHDYLMVGDLPISEVDNFIQKVESEVA